MSHQLEKNYKTTFIFGLGSRHVRERHMRHAIGSEGEITDRKVSLNNPKRIDRSCNVRITPIVVCAEVNKINYDYFGF